MRIGPNDKAESRTAQVFALLIGVGIPMLIVGRFVLGTALILGAVLAIYLSLSTGRWAEVKSAAHSLMGLLVVVTFVAWLPNTYNSLDPGRSLETALRSLSLVCAAVFVWSALSMGDRLNASCRRTLAAAAVFCVMIGVLALAIHPGIYWIIHFDKGQFRGWIDIPLLTDIKPIAALGPMLVPVLIWTARAERGLWRILAAVAVAGFLALVFMATSRSSLVGYLAAGVCVVAALALHRRSGSTKLYFLAVVVIIAGVLFWLQQTRSHVTFDRDWLFPSWLVDFERQEIWAFTLNVFKEHPFIGHGINTINMVPGADVVIPGTNDTHYIPSHPHNWAIEVLAETGWLGLLPLLATVAALFVSLFVRYMRTGTVPILVAIAASAGYWGSGLFNFSFWSVWWQASYLIVLAICFSAERRESP